jgi:NAD(P)-dependent dehydrogenase (short-subunit alcohol dehydrogenase family)
MSVVIVTGGFGILGRAVVAELASRGHKVAAVDVAPAPADYPAALALGGVDLSDEAAVTAAYGTVVKQLGRLDGLVNIAGGFIWEPVEGGALGNWDKMFRMNLLTAAASSAAAIPYLTRQGGAIVNVGAAGASPAGTGMAPYAASKAGVRALTESLADELKGKKVRVNAVLPTIIDTPANRAAMPDTDPAGWVSPRGAAKAIAFLLSDDSGAVTGASLLLSLAG